MSTCSAQSLNLRVIVIGTYFALVHQDSYEGFVKQLRPVFDLEDWALYLSTIVVSVLVFIVGFGLLQAPGAPSSSSGATGSAARSIGWLPTAAASAGPRAAPSASVGPAASASASSGPAVSADAKPVSEAKDTPSATPRVDLVSTHTQGVVLVIAGLLGIIGSILVWVAWKLKAKQITSRFSPS